MRAAKDCDAGVIVWLDFMKYGVVSATELNNSVELVAKALGALPDKACAFVIGPQLCSERRSGLRDEWRLGYRFCGNIAVPIDDAIVPAEDVDEPAPPPKWTSEPKSLEELLDMYIVEQKVSGRQPGVSLYLTMASRRDGTMVDALESQQKYKLFLVLWIGIIDVASFWVESDVLCSYSSLDF
eukprot:s810_g6.t1